MATAGGTVRTWHSPGPGGGSRHRPPWRSRDQDTGEMTLSLPPSVHKRTSKLNFQFTNHDCLKNRKSRLSAHISHHNSTYRWLLAVILLVAVLPTSTSAACSAVSCPSGCVCNDLSSGSCRVDCSNGTSDVLTTLLPSALPADKVGELLLASCSITSVPSSTFQQFTNLVKLDLSSNNIAFLDSSVFQTLTNLEDLHLHGNKLQNLPQNIFAGRGKLRELSLAKNSLSQLDANLFKDLEALQALYLDNNDFMYLPSTIVHGRGNLTRINLSGNPWNCDCSIGALVHWTRQGSRKLLDATQTTCSSPQQLKDTVWSQLVLAQLPCTPSAFMSCFHDDQSGVSTSISLQDSVPTAVTTQGQCDTECAYIGKMWAVFQEGGLCSCGQDYTGCSCPQNSSNYPSPGSTLCSRTYITGAFSVHLGLLLGPTLSTVRSANAQLSLTGAKSDFSTVWDWGDGSDKVNRSSTVVDPLQHNFLLPGVYNVSVEIPSAASTLHWPLHVLDSVGSARLEAPRYSDSKKALDLKLKLDQGTNVTVRWSRFDSSGSQVFGKACSFGWYQQWVHTCIKPTILQAAINYTTAQEKCAEEEAQLIYVSSASSMTSTRNLMSKELEAGHVLLIGAQKSDNVTYVWTRNQHNTYFNTTMVQESEVGDCVGLSSNGLVGMECSSVQSFSCRKGQVYCEYGGKEWQKRSCLLPLGSDKPLSRADAESACQGLRGQLAVIDSEAKNNFLQQNVLNTFSSSWAWIDLNDHHVSGYYTWSNGASLGSYATWGTAAVASSVSAKMCVATSTDGSWKSLPCTQQMGYVCEYPNEEQVSQVQNFISGVGKFTAQDTTITALTPRSENVTTMTDLLLVPGYWFQHAGKVNTFRFATQNLPSSGVIKINFQVYRPVCDTGHFFVPAGCSSQPSPFAACASSSVSCSRSQQSCSAGKQYCPLTDTCLSITTPCSCAALEADKSTGCDNFQYASQSQLTSQSLNADSYRFNGIMPKYSLVGQTGVELNPSDNGLFSVKTSGIDVQPNDVIGLQFISGDYKVLCETTTQDMESAEWGHSMLSLSVIKDPTIEIVNANGAIWLDSMVCNLQALSTIPSEVLPPNNLVDKAVHSAGDYTYKASLYSDISPSIIEYQTTVTMQDAVSDIKLATPDPKWPKRTAEASNLAIVEAHTTEDMLWYIKKGSDPSMNWTIPNAAPVFQTDCPSSLNSHISECSKNYQFVSHRWTAGTAGTLDTITVHAWNMISRKSLTVDILSQERISGFAISPLPVSEFVTAKAALLYTRLQTGSDVQYVWDFGDGLTSTNEKANHTHTYSHPGIYTVEVEASNHLDSRTVDTILKLFRRANVQNLVLTADSEVDMLSEFTLDVSASITQYSSVTVYIDFGDGNFDTITEPELQPKSTLTAQKKHKYSLGNIYTIKVFIVDNLNWDGTTSIPTLVGQSYVTTKEHTLHAWTVLPTLTLSPDQNCHAINSEATFTVNLPQGYNKTSYTFTWDFGDQATVSYYEKDYAKHTFSSPKTYTVTLDIKNSNSKGSATYKKCIETPISDLSLSPKSSLLPLTSGEFSFTKFDVSVLGSDQQYLWSYDGKSSTAVPGAFIARFNSYGTYTVALIVSNHISSQTKTTTVVVQEVITNLTIAHDGMSNNYFKVNQVYLFEARSTTGSNFNTTWTVAQSSNQVLTSDQSAVQTSWPEHGTYEVSVTFSNSVGRQTRTVTAIVERLVTSVILTSPADIQVNNEVSITAQPQGGVDEQNMLYEWTLCVQQKPCVTLGPTTKTLTTTPTDSGTHTYSVRASNNVSSFNQAKTIIVWDKLGGLSIDVNDTYISPNDWGIKGKPLQFTAVLEDGMATELTWTIQGGGYQETHTGQTYTVTLDEEAAYTLTVVATNVIQSISASYEFRVQEAIEDVVIQPLRGDIAYLNETLPFKVVHIKGSFPKYVWQLTLPDGTIVRLGVREEVSNYFDTKGSYTLEVTASNKVTVVIQSLIVQIRDPDTTYPIDIDYPSDPFIHQYIPIVASVKKNPQNLPISWRIYDQYPPALSNQTTIRHNFTERKEFIIEVRISGIVHRKVVYVQGKLPPVTLTKNATTLASGESVLFEATVQNPVDDLEYWWTVGSELIKSKNKILVYQFNVPGKDIPVQVLARNKVSFSEFSVIVTVQDCIEDIELVDCCFYNTSQKQKTKLAAMVTKGTDVSYTWDISKMVLESTSGAEIPVSFSKVGKYEVTINASNLVCTKSKTFIIEAQDPIKGFRWAPDGNPSEVYVGQLVNFQVDLDFGTNVNYRFVLFNFSMSGDHLEQQDSQSKVYPKYFKNQGSVYLLSVTAYNNVSDEIIWQLITAYVIRCEPMVVTPVGGPNRVEIRSRFLDFDAVVDANCTRYPIMYKWMAYKNCDKSQEINIPNVTQPQLILQPRTLDYGDYCIMLRSWYDRTPVIIDMYFNVTIKPSDLISVIEGGTERTVSVLHDVPLVGKAYDPDLTSEKDKGINYQWTFTSTCGSGNSLDPKNTTDVTIPANTLKSGCSYDAKLLISKPGRTSVNTTQTIITFAVDVPLVEIQCASCEATDQHAWFSNGLATKLRGKCKNCGPDVTYAWRVERSDGEMVNLTYDVSTTGSDKANIVIRQGSLSTSHSYTIRLDVNDQSFEAAGHAKLTMNPNQPPSGGICSILNDNSTVIASEQNLEVACTGWSDDDDGTTGLVLYQVHIASTDATLEKYLLYSGSNPKGSFPVSPIEGRAQQVLVIVTVASKRGGKVLALSQPVNIIVQANGDDLLKKLDRGFIVLVLQGSPKELLQFAIALTKQLNSVITSESEGSSSKDQWVIYRSKIIKSLTSMTFAQTLEDMQQLAYLLKHLTNITLGFEQDSETCEALLQLVENMISWMNNQVTLATNPEDIVPDNILDLINNVINGLRLPDTSQNSTTQNNWKLGITERCLNMTTTVNRAYSRSKIAGEEAYGYTSMGMSLIGAQVDPSKIKTEIMFEDCTIKIPPDLLSHLGISEEDSVFQNIMAMSYNPLQGADKGTDDVTSKVLGIEFKYNNNSEIMVSNLDDKHLIEMIMPVGESGSDKKTTNDNSSSIFEPNAAFKASFNTSTFAYGGLNVEILANVVPDENETFDKVRDQLHLTAYIGYGYEPNWYQYNQTLGITINSTWHNNYTFFTTIDKTTPSSIYVSIINNDPENEVNVTVSTYEVQCKHYSFSRSTWIKDGCYPTAASNRSKTTCLCNHLTIFGASSLVTPGDIDFSDLANLDFNDNPVVVILVAVIAGVLIVLVFWARQYDLQDLHNISIVPLCGRDGLYKYEVIILTGQRRGAGTSAHVGIKLYGDESKSGARHLFRMGAFQRNSEDSFLLATQVPLGNLHKIHIWHDNTGKHPSWFVKRVIVRDLQTNGKYGKSFFLVNSWLSLTMEQGSIDKQVFAASSEELTNFGTVFQSETSRGFAERHLWLSVWDRPPRSRFTRVQRVVCCATILYSFMCANVMWYGLINNPKRVNQALGLVSIGWQDFVVGILASIAVFPINFVIIQIFRFTKVKVNAYDYGIKPGTAQTIEVEAMCDMSQAGDSFIAYDRKNSVVPLHREYSSDSIMVAGKAIHTTRRQSRGSIPNVKVDAPSSSNSRQEVIKQVPIESRKWWSYDTILKWPERLPSDVRPESGMAGPLRKRTALRSIKDIDSEEFIIDDDTLRLHGAEINREANNNKRIPITTTSGTLSISQSIAEIEEDVVQEEFKPERSRQYESIPMSTLQIPVAGCSSSGYSSGERSDTDSWSSVKGEKKSDSGTTTDSNHQTSPRDAKLDSDNGSVNRALVEIDTVIKESNEIEPRLLNRKKSSFNQGNAPHVDILRLDDFEHELSKEAVDDDLSEMAALESNPHGLRKTKSKILVSKRWAQIVIPPEYETYRNADFKIFDPEDEYDVVSLNRRDTLKSRGSSLSSSTTFSSRFHQLMPRTTTNARWLLPHFCIYIAYAICFVISGMSIIITILYGHNFGRDLALKWLLAFFISFLDSVFILEPLKVLALAVFVAMLTRGLQEEDGIETRPMIENNETIKDVRMKPIGGFALLQAREEGYRVQRMHRLLRHFCVYFIFVWVAFFITYRAHNTASFPVSNDVQNTLLVPKTVTGKAFNDIVRPADYWSWIQEVAAPAVYPDANETTNTQRLLLGEVRLRQIRSYQVECHVRQSLISLSANTLLSHGCYGDPGWKEDMASYEPGWKVMSVNSSWTHSIPERAMGDDYEGTVSSYGGGGYIETLGPTLQDAQNKLSSLINSNWTDRGTRAVFMEANLYTIPNHLHTTVRIVAEFPVSGGVWMSHDIQSFMLQNHVAGRVTALTIFMACLSLIWAYLLFVVLMGFRRHTWRYFLEWWHCMEFTVMVITLAVIACYIHRVVVDTASHSRYMDQPKQFNSFFYSMTIFRVWKAFSGILVFILTAWMVRALRFIKPFSAYGQTIRVAAPKLVGGIFILLIVIFSLSHLGHLWFGSLLGSFRSVGSSFVTIFSLVRARTTGALGGMHEVSPDMAGFILFSFIATVIIGIMGVFMGILNSTYKLVRLQTYYKNTMEMPDYEMVDFIMKRFKRYIGITKPKPAFRRVKFQGMPSLSSRSSMSSRTGMSQSMVSSGSYDPFGLDALYEETYLEELLDRCVPTFIRMLEKLERVLWLDREITRLESALIEALGRMLMTKRKLPPMPKLLQMKRAAGKIIGSRGSRCHRSNSESLMTDVRAKQIRDALNAELHEMEENIISDTEGGTPHVQRKATKSNSFTVIGEARELDSLAEYEMEILGEAEAGEHRTQQVAPAPGTRQTTSADGNKPPSMGPSAATGGNRHYANGKPPVQPKRFLNSAGPRRTFHEAGSIAASQRKDSANRRESPTPPPVRRPSAANGPRHRPSSPLIRPGIGEVADAPMEAQMAYCSKLPRRDIKIPGLMAKPNFTRRPTSEQSERVKKHPDLPLPKTESGT